MKELKEIRSDCLTFLTQLNSEHQLVTPLKHKDIFTFLLSKGYVFKRDDLVIDCKLPIKMPGLYFFSVKNGTNHPFQGNLWVVIP